MKRTGSFGSIYSTTSSPAYSAMSVHSTYSSLSDSLSDASSLNSAGDYYRNRYQREHLRHPQSTSHTYYDRDERDKVRRDDEINTLTDLFVNMDTSNDPDFFGICAKCHRSVQGEGNGCTAMGQIYHIKCFTCHICHRRLQGVRFYAVDRKPYCADDYVNMLEKCSVCGLPINDRILRAIGKPYHPECFTCMICGKSLDGIPFTVDNANRIYCIDDFHRKFAPRCRACHKPIVPAPGQKSVRVVALDRSFHINCYKCEDCGLLLTSQAEGRGCYPLDDHILCQNCNARRVRLLTAPT